MGYLVVLGALRRHGDLVKASEAKLAREASAMEEWERMLRTEGTVVDYDTFARLAERHGIKGGKWLAHLHSGVVDNVWRRVAWCLAAGKLPRSCASVSVTPANDLGDRDSGSHVLSVWNRDYGEEGEVLRAEKALRASAAVTCGMTYKPDIFSAVGIYRNNEWGLRPALYASAFSPAEGRGKLESGVDLRWSYTVGKEGGKERERGD